MPNASLAKVQGTNHMSSGSAGLSLYDLKFRSSNRRGGMHHARPVLRLIRASLDIISLFVENLIIVLFDEDVTEFFFLIFKSS